MRVAAVSGCAIRGRASGGTFRFMRRCVRPTAAFAVCGALALTLTPAGVVEAAGSRQPIPWSVEQFRYEGHHACHVDTAHHRSRLWWTEHKSQGRIPGADGSCGTRPALVSFFRKHVEGLLGKEHRLGLPRQRTDAWLHEPDLFTGQDLDVSGGSRALDIYLNGATGGGGLASCIRDRSVDGARTAGYVLLGTPAKPTRMAKPVYLTVLAHELTHIGQCAVHDRRGRNGTNASSWVSEGTANMVAAAVMPDAQATPTYDWGDPPVLDDGPVQAVHHSPDVVFGAGKKAAADEVAGNAGYDTWPFWYALTRGGQSMDKLVRLYRVAASRPHGHRTGDVGALRDVYPRRALQRALTTAARFDALAGRIASMDVPYGYWWSWRKQALNGTPEQRLNDVTATAQALDLTVPSGGVAWVRVRPATPDNAGLNLKVTGRNATGRHLVGPGVRVGDPSGDVVAASAPGLWQVDVWPPPTFEVPDRFGATREATGDSEAWVVFANAGKDAAKFHLRASAYTTP
jgi:hypothetical protein